MKCPEKSGLFAHTQDCQHFWHCSNSISYLKKCPGNLVFNDIIKTCDYNSPTCSKLIRRRRVDDKYWSDFKLIAEKDEFVCPEKSGMFAVPNDCQSFWHCVDGISYLKKCPGSLVFNELIKACDFSSPSCLKARS
jgi:hypothetical protein